MSIDTRNSMPRTMAFMLRRVNNRGVEKDKQPQDWGDRCPGRHDWPRNERVPQHVHTYRWAAAILLANSVPMASSGLSDE